VTSILRIARRLRNDDGIALPVVIGLTIVMLLAIGTAMKVASGGIQKADNDQDATGALAAAYAGIEEYQSRLANDSTYQKLGNPAAPFTIATGSNTSVTLPTGPTANAAFGVGTGGTWASVPGSDGTASFRYEIDNSDYQTKGVLHLRSTGRVGNVTRSVVADLKQEGFIDYLYFTDYEVQDPAYSGVTTVDINNVSVCERYGYASPTRPGGCGTIQFGAFDVFTGPVRSNDQMTICGTTFQGAVVTSSSATPTWTKPSGCNNPKWGVGTGPSVQAPIDMPPTNTELKKETRNDLPADVPRPGCLYTGPTVITFEVVGGASKMRVWSPWTKFTNVGATKSAATNPSQCGTPGTGSNGLGSTTGALVDVLNLNLVYVQAVPGIGADDANAPADSSVPTNFECTKASYGTPAGWAYRTISGFTTTYYQRFPMAGEATPTGGGSAGLTHYGCRAGDLYVKGLLGGQTTLAAENYIYVIGDLTYRDKQADMLGLVGQNAVFVWNPMSAYENSLLGDTNREIDAAILSVGHTFQVQNYDQGSSRGTLTVFGAIAQKFRGTVSTSSGGSVSTGYAKAYLYDDRYRNTAPPKFLTPVSTTYGVTQYASVAPAYLANGATK
jgi:type II secretory pathway pseudopilin PulG